MPRACTATCHTLAPLMRLSDVELRCEIHNAASRHPLEGVHLCHELLQHQQYYPTRPGLTDLVGKCLQELGQIIQHQPEL
ncbi:hypothetical protein ACJO2E_08705 [Marinobacter sp. M1N3S26]|uniref:hypothetical protein n=1 Tax=Marinobacter sp. M1N3S26 TaxID=3382299 RepID=UPI00387B00B3